MKVFIQTLFLHSVRNESRPVYLLTFTSRNSTRSFIMFRILNLLLLFFFINNIGTVTKLLSQIKGESVTLPCEIQNVEVLKITLFSPSDVINVCLTEECSGRVIKEGSCDVIIKNLTFSDTGAYLLDVRFKNDLSEEALKLMPYQLHIQGNISVETGDELKLDVLFAKADKVEHQSRISTEWKEVWTKGHGVISDRLTVNNESLIIKEFKVTDAGTYRVLHYSIVLITVTVTESNDELSKTDETEQPAERNWIFPVAVSSVILVLVIVALIVFAVKKRQRRLRENVSFRAIPPQEPAEPQQP